MSETSLDPRLARVAVVLYEPQDDINIGNVVRASKNFGITDIRLVRPAEADARRISISAPKAEDLVSNLAHFDSLEEALSDRIYVVGTTARARKGAWIVTEPRGAAVTLVERASEGGVALLFGREDSGLPNSALDSCHAVVNIPTRPDYSSLNLGQAVLLLLWEVFRVAEDVPLQVIESARRPESEFAPAPIEGVERMLSEAEKSLEAIEFFKSAGREHIVRSVRSVLTRAELDERELSIWFGIFKEIREFMKRKFDYGDTE